jgi:hypothetical protein
MNKHEFEQARNSGRLINNRPVQEIEEILDTVCNRLSLNKWQRPNPETLNYIARQVYHRHHYTVEELYLAVDLYNAGVLQYTLDNQPFGLKELNTLMAAYRNERIRVTGDTSQQEKPELTEEEVQAIRKQKFGEINDVMQTGQRYETIVMHIWMIAFKHLVDTGKRTMADLDRYKAKAEIDIKREAIVGAGSLFKQAFRGDVDDYAARLAVEAYIREGK